MAHQLRLGGLDAVAHGEGDLTLLLMHGAGAGQRHPFMAGVAAAVAVHGIRVVTFDFPYITDGRRLPDRAPRLLAALDQAVDALHVPASSLFIGGKSLGGRMATMWLVAGGRAAGLVVLGYPLNPPRGLPQPERAQILASVPGRGLIVQGSRDGFGHPDLIAATAPAAILVHPLPGADHAFAVPQRTAADVLAEVSSLTAAFLLTKP